MASTPVYPRICFQWINDSMGWPICFNNRWRYPFTFVSLVKKRISVCSMDRRGDVNAHPEFSWALRDLSARRYALILLQPVITGNYNDQLTNVLRYPSVPTAQNTKSSNVPSLLLMQARSLMSYPNPSTGVSIIMQNRSELGIAVQPREPSSPRQTHKLPSSAFALKSHSPVSSLSGPSLLDKQSFPNKIHRILDNNNSLGIQRSFQNTLGAISDLRVSIIYTKRGTVIERKVCRRIYRTYLMPYR